MQKSVEKQKNMNEAVESKIEIQRNKVINMQKSVEGMQSEIEKGEKE